MENKLRNKLIKLSSNQKIDLIDYIIIKNLLFYHFHLKYKSININILFNLLYINKVLECIKEKDIKIFINQVNFKLIKYSGAALNNIGFYNYNIIQKYKDLLGKSNPENSIAATFLSDFLEKQKIKE
jgi:hypothetical protein